MRDRLIELLKEKQTHGVTGYVNHPTISNGKLAEYLLKNGVILPPCKVGDKLYTITAGIIREYEVFEFRFDGDVMWFWAYNDEYPPYFQKLIDNVEVIGKTVFLTREEAEQALKGGAE